MKRLECLDGLRGLLAVYVMLGHMAPFAAIPDWLGHLLSHGGAAVDVFFILSGLVIVRSLENHQFAARPFLLARVVRIFPVFLIMFAAGVAIQPLPSALPAMPWIEPGSPVQGIWSEGWPDAWAIEIVAHLIMTHGLFPDGILPDVWVHFLGAAWSLSTEWQFYCLALVLGRTRMGMQWLAASFLALALAGVLWPVLTPAPWHFSRAFLPNKAHYFALGIASAICIDCRSFRFLALVLPAVLSLCLARGNMEKLLPPLFWVFCLGAQLCQQMPGMVRAGAFSRRDDLISLGRCTRRYDADGLSAPRWVGRILSARCLFAVLSPLRGRLFQWLGLISYLIYLANEPVQKILGMGLALCAHGNAVLFTVVWIPAAVLLPIGLAAFLHRHIEKPMQRRARGVGRPGQTNGPFQAAERHHS